MGAVTKSTGAAKIVRLLGVAVSVLVSLWAWVPCSSGS
jgi:hypothetical protein